MKSFFDLIVVIPVGPNSNVEFVTDTINSFIFHTKSTHKIIIADDSQQLLGVQLQKNFPNADVVKSKKSMGAWAGLYIMLSLAYRYAIEKYEFIVLLKMDTDALVIGNDPEMEALHLFKTNPLVGIAGQYPSDYYGKPWNLHWPKARILNRTTTWKFISNPVANLFLRRLYNAAVKNGYKTGESVFGGAYFISNDFLKVLHQKKLLPNYRFKKTNLGEDHFFSLMAKASGFELGNLSSGKLPFGCAWQGLPAAPWQLIEDGKKIIHSTRYWQNMDEEQIRDYFRNKRQIVQSAKAI